MKISYTDGSRSHSLRIYADKDDIAAITKFNPIDTRYSPRVRYANNTWMVMLKPEARGMDRSVGLFRFSLMPTVDSGYSLSIGKSFMKDVPEPTPFASAPIDYTLMNMEKSALRAICFQFGADLHLKYPPRERKVEAPAQDTAPTIANAPVGTFKLADVQAAIKSINAFVIDNPNQVVLSVVDNKLKCMIEL